MNSTPSLLAFVDPYWLGLDSAQSSTEALKTLIRKLSGQYQLERIYLYQEPDSAVASRGLEVPCTVRPCARDDIDDGFELIRAMDQDMHQLAASKRYATFLVVSMDDRLALSIERLKAQGICVMGLQSPDEVEGEESAQRMSQVFDRMISAGVGMAAGSPRRPAAPTEPPNDAAMDAIGQAIEQWFQESDEMTRDGALEFMSSRRGLPKHVDSRLLFLCSKALSRELTEPEKITLRGRFRQTATERASSLPA